MTLSGISASGMQVAARQQEVAATNTANRQTDGFQRRALVQSEAPGGGVQAQVVTTQADNSGLSAVIADTLDARSAVYAFAANAAVLRAHRATVGSLFDAFA
ncbi:hypothetical protein [Thermomonas hydrothermalis]|uniref:Flagellar basal body rod protein n=1 Tax=Thermomonas hydrothermalis TaxID=213588 RepID=A0A1M4S6V1_9GAMM|nr:hypothetical protein [Thermomonas hydrothermalis]SHE27918.1 hypothetical protein SAMN02745204_00096 [Thermomonas hydrothermalis]